MRRTGLFHQTRYDFSEPVTLGPHKLLLRPREDHSLRIESSKLHIEPNATLRWHSDAFDNSVAVAVFEVHTSSLTIESELVIAHYDTMPFDFIVADHAVGYPFTYSSSEIAVLLPFITVSKNGSSVVRDWIKQIWKSPETIQTFALLMRLNTHIQTVFTYEAREEVGVQSPEETIARGIGSCRDFANLFMRASRHLGFASRFVSGYLSARSSTPLSGATHAWAEVYLPGAGWKGFDPTVGELVGDKHIAVAVARTAEDVPPVSGTFFGKASSNMHVRVSTEDM